MSEDKYPDVCWPDVQGYIVEGMNTLPVSSEKEVVNSKHAEFLFLQFGGKKEGASK